MEPPHGRIVEAKLDHPSRPRRASYLLRGVCLVGGGNGTDPEIWDDGEIADPLSHAVALFGSSRRWVSGYRQLGIQCREIREGVIEDPLFRFEAGVYRVNVGSSHF